MFPFRRPPNPKQPKTFLFSNNHPVLHNEQISLLQKQVYLLQSQLQTLEKQVTQIQKQNELLIQQASQKQGTMVLD
jgi:hypothetical protein